MERAGSYRTRVVAWVVTLGVLVASCSDGGDARWAAAAGEWLAAYVEMPNQLGGAAYDRFWADDMWFDDRSLTGGREVISRQAALMESQRVMPPETRTAKLDGAPLINVDGAMTLTRFDWEPSGADRSPGTGRPAHLVTVLESIGPDGAQGVTTAMSSTSWRERRSSWDEADRADELAEMWVQVWTAGDTHHVAELYADIAVVSDSIARWQAYGIDEIATTVGSAPLSGRIATLGDGSAMVYPVSYFNAGLDGLIAILEGSAASGCGGRIAAVLTVNLGRVIAEERYWEIDRARTCLPQEELPPGWWTDLSMTDGEPSPRPTEDLETVTGTVTVGDRRVELRNSTEHLARLAEWAMGRFAAAGLDVPNVTGIVFSEHSPQCDDVAGRTLPGDEGWTIIACETEAGACRDEACTGFELDARHTILHELAHAWIEDHVAAETRQRFMELVEVAAWDDRDSRWSDRAVEHAAENIAWGLIDYPLYLRLVGGPSPEELTTGFALLTGATPINPWR